LISEQRKEKSNVIQHIVLLRLKPDVTEEQIRAAFEAAQELPDEIPGLVKFSYGRDRSNPSHGFNVASVVQLTDEEALAGYLDHPGRLAYIAEHVDPLTEERIELDVPSDGTHGPSVLSWYWGSAAHVMHGAQR
jgi:Stress responsive A/B Barrel Domain